MPTYTMMSRYLPEARELERVLGVWFTRDPGVSYEELCEARASAAWRFSTPLALGAVRTHARTLVDGEFMARTLRREPV